jgi:hypothetical protein
LTSIYLPDSCLPASLAVCLLAPADCYVLFLSEEKGGMVSSAILRPQTFQEVMSGSRLTPWTEDAPRQSCAGLALTTWKISGSKKILLEAGSLTAYSHGGAPPLLVSAKGRRLCMATNDQRWASEGEECGQVGSFLCYYIKRLLCCLACMRFECVCPAG